MSLGEGPAIVMRHLLMFLAAALLTGGCVQAGTATKPAGPQADRRVSRGEEGAIRNTVRACWNASALPASTVTLRVARVNPDGTVPPDAVTVVDDGGNPRWALAARRAVLNPLCQPWPRPPGGWPNDSFILVFDPKDVF